MDISIAVERSSGLERRLRVRVPRRHVEDAIDARLRELGGAMRVKGFRPGKVPLELVRQRHEKETRRTVVQELLQRTCREAIKRENMEAVAPARIEQEGTGDDDPLIFVATFEIYPDIRVIGLDELAAARPVVTVTDADVDVLVERLRRQRRSWSPVDAPAAAGDRLIVDVDGAPGVALVLGETPIDRDAEQRLTGVRAGTELACGAASVLVREVSRPSLPLVDAGFCRSFGIESGDVAELRAAAARDMTRDAEAHVATVLRLQLLGQLAAKTDVELPKLLCEQEVARVGESLAGAGIPDAIAAEPRADRVREVAERKVRMGLIVRQVFREQRLRILREEVNERIVASSRPGEDPEERQNWYYEHPEMLSQVEFAVMDDKVVDWLKRKAQIVEQPMSFVELMALRAELL